MEKILMEFRQTGELRKNYFITKKGGRLVIKNNNGNSILLDLRKDKKIVKNWLNSDDNFIGQLTEKYILINNQVDTYNPTLSGLEGGDIVIDGINHQIKASRGIWNPSECISEKIILECGVKAGKLTDAKKVGYLILSRDEFIELINIDINEELIKHNQKMGNRTGVRWLGKMPFIYKVNETSKPKNPIKNLKLKSLINDKKDSFQFYEKIIQELENL